MKHLGGCETWRVHTGCTVPAEPGAKEVVILGKENRELCYMGILHALASCMS